MKKFAIVLFSGLMIFLLSCSNEPKDENNASEELDVIKFEELKQGDIFNNLKISDVSKEGEFITIKFENEIVLEDTLNYYSSPFSLSLKKSLFTDKILVGEEVIDLAVFDEIGLMNTDKITQFIPEHWLQSTPDGGKKLNEAHQNLTVKLLLNEITLATNRMYPVSANITKVVEFNGEEDPEPAQNNQPQIYKISELENGMEIMGHEVFNYVYKPRDEFGFQLKGQWEISGNFIFNEMWYELSFQPDEESKTNVSIDYDGSKKPLIWFMGFSNASKVEKVLGPEKMEEIKAGKQVPATIIIKNYGIGGKLDGYGEAQAEFVEIIK